MGTHSFLSLSLSLSSQLPFLLAAALSIILHEWGSPGHFPSPEGEGWWGLRRGGGLIKILGRQRQVQAKI